MPGHGCLDCAAGLEVLNGVQLDQVVAACDNPGTADELIAGPHPVAPRTAARVAALAEAIRADRLVTLTGPGGSGKTRLALEVAASLVPMFADGVWFVALATIHDGARLCETVSEVLGVSDIAGEAIADTLEHWLSDRDLLLILDNCEHVVEAAGGLCQRLLPACSRLRILATSGEFLDVRGEHAIQTPPLAVPDDLALAPLSDAVQLFLAPDGLRYQLLEMLRQYGRDR